MSIYMNTYLYICMYLFQGAEKFNSLLPFHQSVFSLEVMQKRCFSRRQRNITYHFELTSQESWCHLISGAAITPVYSSSSTALLPSLTMKQN